MRERHSVTLYFMVWMTLIIGMLLTILPLPAWAIWWRPRWVLLILLFWTVESQGRVGIGTAWLAGMLLDLLTGTLLGQHALIMACLIYLINRIYPRIYFFPSYQQTVIILFIIWFDLLLNRWLMLFMQQPVSSRLYWLSALTSALIWPWVKALLHDNRSLSLRYY